jgi:hypothetical protein
MAYSSFGHPLILFIAGQLVSTATAAFTQKGSLLRPFAFLVTVAISWLGLSNFQDYIQTTGWAGRSLASAICSIPNILFDRLIIRKWAYGSDYLGPVEASSDERKRQSRWEFGSEVSGSTRCTGSAKEASNVPHFSEGDPRYVPPLSAFLLRHLCLVVGLYHLHTLCIDMQLRSDQAFLEDTHISFLSRITDVSLEEIVTRVRISVAYWVALYCFCQFFYSLFALTNVALKPTELRLWRPLFGSIKTSSTMRGYWG